MIMIKDLTIGKITGNLASQLVCRAIFNRYGIRTARISVDGQDTVFNYLITSEAKTTKKQLRELQTFTFGMKIAMEALEYKI